MRSVLLEVCVDNATGLAAAIAGGADRIELCSALSVGGLTPSKGLMELAANASIPVYAMIRPRAGDFVYNASEIEIMSTDIDQVRECGLAGVVMGASNPDGTLNSSQLDFLTAHAKGLGLSLHRAFDLVPDFRAAIDISVELGFERILTSGGSNLAIEGIAKLIDCMEYAATRIIIMPGGGVNDVTVLALMENLPLQEIHASCSNIMPQYDSKLLELGFSAAGFKATDQSKVEALCRAIKNL